MPIIAFLTGGIGRWIVLTVVVSAGVAWGCHHLINIGRQQVLVENQKAAVKIVTKQGAVTVQVVDHYIKVQGQTKVVTQTVEKEVVKYEAAKLDTCVLSNEFVRVYDDSTVNSVPKPSEGVDGTPSGLTAAQALTILTGNNATYHQVADELRGLQDWVTQQQTVTQPPAKRWWQK